MLSDPWMDVICGVYDLEWHIFLLVVSVGMLGLLWHIALLLSRGKNITVSIHLASP